MKRLSFLISGILLVSFITGCSSVKRYKSVTYKSQDNTLVDMELFGSRLTMNEMEPPDKNLWNLSASAQNQLIQILNERYPDNGQFISALNNKYLTGGGINSLDLTRKKLRMVFTISKHRDYSVLTNASSRFSPADRIEYLNFSLEIDPPLDYTAVTVHPLHRSGTCLAPRKWRTSCSTRGVGEDSRIFWYRPIASSKEDSRKRI